MEYIECQICFETVCMTSFLRLECLHSLCRKCSRRLKRLVCPFCRRVINKEVIYPQLHMSKHIQVKNWNEYGMTIEDLFQRRASPRERKKHRRHRYNSRREKWSKQNQRTIW